MFKYSIEEIIQDFKNGHFVILVDDENRENEGDIMIAAEFINTEKYNFLMNQARGQICLVLSPEQTARLKLPLMISNNHEQSPSKTSFLMTIDAVYGVTTGISTQDKLITIAKAINTQSKPQDFYCPGHVFPLCASVGGVLARAGHTEASYDLARLAGLNSASLICEVLNSRGEVASRSELIDFAEKFGFKIGTIADLIKYRMDRC